MKIKLGTNIFVKTNVFLTKHFYRENQMNENERR